MHARFVRSAVRSAAFAAAMTGTLTWAPAATAQTSDPPPAAPAPPAETPIPDTGSIVITKKDTTGEVLPGAVFLLLDADGREAGRGETDLRGELAFRNLAPGVYRLKETSSGSPLHEVVADQDVIVTPGATTRLTITDLVKAAKVLLRAKDEKTGKLLPGATVNIGSGDRMLLTLTTGAKGTASGKLPMSSRTTTQFWVRQITAPAGYDLYKPSKSFTAGPGAPVTVTITNAATAPKPDLSGKPTHESTGTPSTPAGKSGTSDTGGAKHSATGISAPDAESSPTAATTPASDTTPKAPAGSLAHTGADATPWIAGGAGLLVALGVLTLAVTRRRTPAEPDDNSKTS
ncbi:SpaA isopeptide-forming pilin-related protein [Streptomyces sp. NPDC006923]|uniref:SpaA isopeptide-forming pilin-related protein n=1 Tax=Streptomyces sp. NPDC006923 TaxID=3155355 RepID=UPI0033DE497F